MNQLNKSDDSFRTVNVLPALVALPSVQPQVAPAALLTQVRDNDSYQNPWRFIDALRFYPQQAISALADLADDKTVKTILGMPN
ncbi:MAG: hypothetical protein EZS28_001208 [Streblomastix strix]|uniref:Uncharacterized protein n=1 Tax=Streblomastix strix TaxID=222440 RepID=A0A5J4X9K3_9EUKA|nr:MAG: hypothetical protein EZS28_001208 [Streblomastix strix]